MPRFRKKPVEVDAIRWTGKWGPIVDFFGIKDKHLVRFGRSTNDTNAELEVMDVTHDRWLTIKMGEWIIRGVHGEYYPCDANVFDETYTPVGDANG